MNDIRVESWDALNQALYDIPRTPHQRYRSNYVYRGVADASWDLATSLKRLGPHAAAVEKPLLRSFRKYAEPGSMPSESLWVRLAVAQHHGLPTRVLDWTVAPKVALHFATAEEEHHDKDAAIWCVDVAAARRLLPDALQKVLKTESAFVFSVEMLAAIRSLDEFDASGQPDPYVLFFEPPSLDARIVNQGAVLSVMPGAELLLGDLLKRHPDLYHRLIIPRTLKWEVRDKLDQDNVSERMLFPGLDGLSRWLKRYYGSGPAYRGAEFRDENFLVSADPGKLDPEAIHAFLTDTYWAAGISRETVTQSLRGSLCFGVYELAGEARRQIGFARVITDRATFGYVADVYIVKEFRGLGLAKWLMECVVAHPDLAKCRRLMLATRDAQELYSRSGFKPLAHPEHHLERRPPGWNEPTA